MAAFTRYLAEAVPQLQPLQEHLPSAHLPLLQHSGATLHVHAAPPLPPHLLQRRRMNIQNVRQERLADSPSPPGSKVNNRARTSHSRRRPPCSTGGRRCSPACGRRRRHSRRRPACCCSHSQTQHRWRSCSRCRSTCRRRTCRSCSTRALRCTCTPRRPCRRTCYGD